MINLGDLLNRMRVGEKTKKDLNLLETRVRPKNHPDMKGALYIAFKRKNDKAHNVICLNDLPGQLYESKAINFIKMKKNCKPPISEYGTIGN